MTNELDRAIVEGRKAEAKTLTFVMLDVNRPVFAFERNYARALVAELLRGIEDTDGDSYSSGFNAALAEIRRRAGLEDEG